MLTITSEIIDNLEPCDERIVDKYLKQILKEVAAEAKIIGAQKARENANKKYGKGWRERLRIKKIYRKKNPFGKISYY